MTVIRPLASTDYGSQEFAVRDPEGNAWSFGTYRGEPRGLSRRFPYTRAVLRRVLVGLLALAAVLGLAVALRITWVGYGPPPASRVAEAQTRFLQRAIADGAGDQMQQLFPEGDYFLRALTAMAEARTRRPDLAAVRALRDSLDRPESVAVFGSGMVPEHGIFQVGWALAVAVDLARASGAPADADDVRRRAAVVESALRGSRSGFLEGYPGQYWPCDTVVAASALADAAVLLERPSWLDTVRRLAQPGDDSRRPDHRAAAAPGRRRRPGARGSAWLLAVDHPGVLAGHRAGAGRPGRSRRLGGVPADVRGPRGRAGRRT